ncbi:thermonuclease family protein [Agrobacterium rosae]|uniref:thermonuclease family protein n=1 Tax=Agrobacterium rosae TaxID=1972867 RepID=UPI003B9E91B2
MKKLVVILLVALLPASACASNVTVVDGDTLDVDGVRYRLHGIDAPEASQTCLDRMASRWDCGQAAITMIKKLTSNGSVTCDARGKDAYDRTLAVCTAGGVEINSEMVRRGMAWAFRRYSLDYARLEDVAAADRVGVWQAETQTPWDYRAERWGATDSSAPDPACPIKGNVNRKQEKIYHVPWSKDYSKTRVNERKGERWFCSEDEAIAAGWRAPSWGY